MAGRHAAPEPSPGDVPTHPMPAPTGYGVDTAPMPVMVAVPERINAVTPAREGKHYAAARHEAADL